MEIQIWTNIEIVVGCVVDRQILMDLSWSSEVSQSIASGVTHTHTLLSSHLWRYHFHLLGNAFEIKRTKIRNQFHETMISSKTESCFAWKYFLYFLRCSSCFIARILSCQAHWDLFCQDESQTPSGELVKANWPSLMKMFCRDVMPTPIAQPQDVRVVVNVYY